MVTLIRVNTPSLPVRGIPPTLSMQILCFAVLSPREREWPLHLSSYPRQKPDSFRCLNTGRFISLISALTLVSLACWWGWARSEFLLVVHPSPFFSFPTASFPKLPYPCVYVLAILFSVLLVSEYHGCVDGIPASTEALPSTPEH